MHIYISRDLLPDSPFVQELEAKGDIVHGESLIEFDFVPFNYFPFCEWIFFYSPRCVQYFFEMADDNRYKNSRFAVMGPGTARAMIECDIVPDFIGNGNPEQTAESFCEEAYEQRVLFPQAENSRKSVENLIADQVEVIDIVVYSNLPKKEFSIPDSDVLVFTSPLNAQTYFEKYPLKKEQKVLAIGKTTAEGLRNLGVLKFHIAPMPTIKGILEEIEKMR
jgi:uroporphyrinogen-III synthase